jgi:ligand-binding SRPBCC domain-containing protein
LPLLFQRLCQQALMRFVKESLIRAIPERVFEFHEQPDVLTLLIPPWESARVVQPAKISEVGSQAIVETKIFGPVKVRWVALHTVYDPPHVFEDVQIKGPFRSWQHRHVVEPAAGGTILRDEIDYEPPLWFLGRLFAPILVQKRLQKLFDYRHGVTREWCEGEGKDEGGRMKDEG